MMSGSSWAHPLGTDNLGRDLLTRLSSAIRESVLPLWITVTICSSAGVYLAVVASASPRLARFTTIADQFAALFASIPASIAALGIAAYAELTGLVPVMIAISAVFIARSYLQVRGLYLHDQKLQFWIAHETLGGTPWARVWQYGVRSHWRDALSQGLVFNLRAVVSIEASLSYLGFGVQEPNASFGNMLASHFDSYLHGHFGVLVVIIGGLALCAAAPRALLRVSARLICLVRR